MAGVEWLDLVSCVESGLVMAGVVSCGESSNGAVRYGRYGKGG